VKSPDLLAKLFFAIDFFFENTSARWLWRGTDDVIINFALLGGLVESLDARHRAAAEFVVIGNCQVDMFAAGHPRLLQGGSGFMMSRFAAAKVRAQAQHIMRTGYSYEDHSLGRLLTAMGAGGEIASDGFLGSTMSSADKDMFLRGNFERMAACKATRPADACGQFLSPVRRVVFFHQMRMNVGDKLFALAQSVFAAPADIMWYMLHGLPFFCRMNA
jgi:hypothetical protein